jgi:predicted nicotinamide N-methyase
MIEAAWADRFTAAVRAHLPVRNAPCAPEIRLHLAGPGAQLARVIEAGPKMWRESPPYWAYQWGGGAALACWIAERGTELAGKRIADLGSGSGLLAIAAIRAGAASVYAVEIDPRGCAVIPLNAALNGVQAEVIESDAAAADLSGADVILAGDVFYEAQLAKKMLPVLQRCVRDGARVLVGDPGRAPLPRGALKKVARYAVRDFGEPEDGVGWVFEVA